MLHDELSAEDAHLGENIPMPYLHVTDAKQAKGKTRHGTVRQGKAQQGHDEASQRNSKAKTRNCRERM